MSECAEMAGIAWTVYMNAWDVHVAGRWMSKQHLLANDMIYTERIFRPHVYRVTR